MVTKLPASPAHMAILITSSFSSRVAQIAKPSAPTLSNIPKTPATKPNDRPPVNGVNATATIKEMTIPATANHFCHHGLLGSTIGSTYPGPIGRLALKERSDVFIEMANWRTEFRGQTAARSYARREWYSPSTRRGMCKHLHDRAIHGVH